MRGACRAVAIARAIVLLPVPGYPRITMNVLPLYTVLLSLLSITIKQLMNSLSFSDEPMLHFSSFSVK